MANQKNLTAVTVEQVTYLTLDELCSICQVTPDYIQQAIELSIVDPIGTTGEWRFNDRHLKRLRIVVHLQNDLEINLAGGALAIELMEELEQLRSKIATLERLCK